MPKLTRNTFTRLGLPVIGVFTILLLLAAFSATASAQESSVIGRGFIGVVKSVSTANGLVAVESKGNLFQVAITDTTVINAPPNQDVGLEGLPTELGFKIAGLVDSPITDDQGFALPDIHTALKITVIPDQPTRSHKRTIAGDKDGGNLTAVDAEGAKTSLAGRGEGIEKGESLIILVQKSGGADSEEKVRGVLKAKTVSDRLEVMLDSESDDPLKASLVADLREKREDAEEQRLKKTAGNLATDFSEFVLSKVTELQEGKVARQEVLKTEGGVGAAVSECARGIVGRQAASITELSDEERQRLTDECLKPPKPPEPVPDLAPTIDITSPVDSEVATENAVLTVTAEAKDDLGVVSVTFNVGGTDLEPLTEAPYSGEITVPSGESSLTITATAKDTGGNENSASITLKVIKSNELGVKITSPLASVIPVGSDGQTSRPSTISGANKTIAEGDTIGVRGEVTGMGVITVVFRINGVNQTPIAAPPYAMEYFVPYTSGETVAPLNISATATDGSGDSALDSLSAEIVRNVTTINIRIITPTVNTKATAGDTIVIKSVTENDADMAFVTFKVGGTKTVLTTSPFNLTYVLPRRANSVAAISNVPPNVFVGTARLDGRLAPDGTKVIAWIVGSDATKLPIEVTATADSGETDTASLSIPVSGTINAGEATVVNGKYVLTAAQPMGQSFSGKTIIFTIGGKDTSQTGTWEQGAATILDLTAD